MLKTFTRSSGTPAFEVPLFSEKRFMIPTAPPATTYFVFTHDPYTWLYEKIESDNKGGSGIWKPCQHYKRWSSFRAGRMGCYWSHRWNGNSSQPYIGYLPAASLLYKWSSLNPNTGFGELSYPIRNLTAYYTEMADGSFEIPLPASLAALKQRSLNATLPVIKSELSLVNSIIELKDFASLGRTIAGLRSLVKYLRSRGAIPLSQWLRSGADVYLQTQFNIMPLISDIRGIRTALSRYEKRINELVAREGRVRTKHFTCFIDEPSYVSIPDTVASAYYLNTGQFAQWTLDAGLQCWRTVIQEKTIFHAEIRYNYNYTQYQREHARVLALLDAFGINLNPSIIWNAIPWSFALDWLIGVNRWLDQFKITNMEPQINILSYLWSVKRVRHIDCTVQQYTSKWSTTQVHIGRQPMPRITEMAYRRHVEIPSISSITSSGLNLKEFSLAAALVLSRRRRSKRR